MALLEYFKGYLPTVKTRDEANVTVSQVLTERSQLSPQQRGQHKQKAYTAFTDEQRAAAGWYSAEHSKTAAVNRGQLTTEFKFILRKNLQALKLEN